MQRGLAQQIRGPHRRDQVPTSRRGDDGLLGGVGRGREGEGAQVSATRSPRTSCRPRTSAIKAAGHEPPPSSCRQGGYPRLSWVIAMVISNSFRMEAPHLISSNFKQFGCRRDHGRRVVDNTTADRKSKHNSSCYATSIECRSGVMGVNRSPRSTPYAS